MRPDRQRRGARHGRGRKAGNAPERIPAPIRRAAALFLYLARPGAGFSPFPGFPRRVGKGHPSHRQKSASKPPNVWGVAALALRCRERSGAGSLSAEIQLGFTCAIPTPPLLFYFQSAGKRPRSAARGFLGRWSAVVAAHRRACLQISGAMPCSGRLCPPHVKACSAFLSCHPPVVRPFKKTPLYPPWGSALPCLPDQRRRMPL